MNGLLRLVIFSPVNILIFIADLISYNSFLQSNLTKMSDTNLTYNTGTPPPPKNVKKKKKK